MKTKWLLDRRAMWSGRSRRRGRNATCASARRNILAYILLRAPPSLRRRVLSKARHSHDGAIRPALTSNATNAPSRSSIRAELVHHRPALSSAWLKRTRNPHRRLFARSALVARPRPIRDVDHSFVAQSRRLEAVYHCENRGTEAFPRKTI